MKKLFIFILSFPLLTSFGQSTNSFCSFNQNGEKYELNLVDGTGSVTWVKYNRSGDILNSGSGTWSISNDAVYGGLYERLTVNIPTGQMKFLVVRTSRGAIQELQDESAYKRNFQPCTGILSGGSNQNQKIIQYNPNASMIIGTPITIGTLMIASKDMPEPLDWWEAKEECLRLGDGWRLPTKEELDLIYENKSRIGVFKNGGYWSISQSANRMTNDGVLILAWTKNFKTGIKTDYEKKEIGYVRAVKTGVANSEVKEPIKEPAKLPVKINIIGTPITIGNLEVAQYSFPQKIDWVTANLLGSQLGNGWRLPTKDELNILFLNKAKIGGFADDYYWSSTEFSTSWSAWSQLFIDGIQYSSNKNFKNYVRAVRDMNNLVNLTETKKPVINIIGTPIKENISKSNIKDDIIGKSIKIGNLEIAQNDFRKIPWTDANNSCINLGDGWRLPTIQELKILYQNREIIGNFKWDSYWSSTKGNVVIAWRLNFGDGMIYDRDNTDNTACVRAVRSF